MSDTLRVPLSEPGAVHPYLAEIVRWHDHPRRTVYGVLCDEFDRPLLHQSFPWMPADPPVEFCGRFAGRLAAVVSRRITYGRLLVAVTRLGRRRPLPADRRWSAALQAMCAESEVASLGCCLVTPRRITPVAPDVG
jgi:hypothetical protein